MSQLLIAKLEQVLQGLREVKGVQGAMVIDHVGAVLAHNAHAIYDATLLQRVARSVVSSIDAVGLVQDDWEVLTADFGDGKLVLRRLQPGGAKPISYALAVITDATLNLPFLGVALRVAASKVQSELEAVPPASAVAPVAAASAAAPPPASSIAGRLPLPPPAPEIAAAGHTWSGTGPIPTAGTGAGLSHSDISVIDAAAASFLSACTKALGASVGPMARVFVKETVRRICGERPFARSDGAALIAQLTLAIDDTDDRAAFQRATRSL
jgi:predicted regulator of Ras-like GTPase activity (Roadblock/LC7/MglB family)